MSEETQDQGEVDVAGLDDGELDDAVGEPFPDREAISLINPSLEPSIPPPIE